MGEKYNFHLNYGGEFLFEGKRVLVALTEGKSVMVYGQAEVTRVCVL
jgi:hypothetical protein